VTLYRLNGPGIEPRSSPEQPWAPPNPFDNGYLVIPRGKPACAWRWPPTTSSVGVTKGVEIYTSTPLWDFVACSRVNFTLTFTFNFIAVSSQQLTSKFFPIYNLLIMFSAEALHCTLTDSFPQQPTCRKLICLII